MRDTVEKQGQMRDASFLERLAEKVGIKASSATVFGTPIERDGVTIITVTRARWGFGGGSGRKSKEQGDDEGVGGGGAVQVAPVGYIELRDGEARFVPIQDPALRLPILLAGGALALLLLRSIRRLARG